MKRLFTIMSGLILLLVNKASAQGMYFPPLTGNTWETATPASLGWCTNYADSLLNYVGSRNSKAFILLKNGRIVLEQYYGTFTRDSAWYWASAGKSLTSAVVGIAQKEGYLSISDTTSKYLGKNWTSCTPSQEAQITVRHQLTMTSGLDDGVPDNHCTFPACLVFKKDAGTRWAYHNAPYTLLDKVLEQATGQTLNSYLSQKILLKTGMSGVFIKQGYNNVFFSKPRSMARYGLLILNRGVWNGTAVLTDTAYFRQMVTPSQDINKSYGYLWWLNGKKTFMMPGTQLVFPGSWNPHAPADMIAALGKNGQIINVVPSMDLVFIRMGNAPALSELPILFNDTVWIYLNALMCQTNRVDPVFSPKEIKIFPNPVTDHIRLDNLPLNGRIDMVSPEGKVLCAGECATEIDCTMLARGMYYLRIYNADGGLTGYSRFIKQ